MIATPRRCRPTTAVNLRRSASPIHVAMNREKIGHLCTKAKVAQRKIIVRQMVATNPRASARKEASSLTVAAVSKAATAAGAIAVMAVAPRPAAVAAATGNELAGKPPAHFRPQKGARQQRYRNLWPLAPFCGLSNCLRRPA